MVAALATVAAACGGSASPRYTADAQRYLLTLDQMVASDFTVAASPASLTATALAAGDAAVAQQLESNGLASAAQVTFARTVEFSTANGPVEVIDAVERFATADGAHASYRADVSRRDRQQGEVATSAGSLGDEAHADSLVATAPDGLQAVQIALEWRIANVIVLLQVRGRYGGTRLDDALVLAHRQTSTQLR
jgi:hypothetical protein